MTSQLSHPKAEKMQPSSKPCLEEPLKAILKERFGKVWGIPQGTLWEVPQNLLRVIPPGTLCDL